MKSLELFAGGGGLALGLEQAGFRHIGLIEQHHDACETLRANSQSPLLRGRAWPILEADVRHIRYEQWGGQVHLLAGGPPCQPFSIAGKHAGDIDQRNLFPVVFQAVRAIQPQAILLENVRGLKRTAFLPYLTYILLQLRYPTIMPRSHETWIDHKSRLEQLQTERAHVDLRYNVFEPQIINLVDFGVPQHRERLFIVAMRTDLGINWEWPQPTHSKAALLYAQWVSGEYWDKHHMPIPTLPQDLAHSIARLQQAGKPDSLPWKTVRDALQGLPEPRENNEHPLIAQHAGIPGARSYYGHSGSAYDLPAKTLKAGDHGVPGGENMLRRND